MVIVGAELGFLKGFPLDANGQRQTNPNLPVRSTILRDPGTSEKWPKKNAEALVAPPRLG